MPGSGSVGPSGRSVTNSNVHQVPALGRRTVKPMSGYPIMQDVCAKRAAILSGMADRLPTPPTFEEFEAWAGTGRVQRATEPDLAAWRLPEAQKNALMLSGVPMFEELVSGVSLRATPTMYQLAYLREGNEPIWDYGAVPDTGEVREWPPDGRQSRFANSTINHWLCSLNLAGSWFTHSSVIHRWDEEGDAEEQALAEIDALLDQIGAIDPAAIGDGSHETHFWPAVLGRWLY